MVTFFLKSSSFQLEFDMNAQYTVNVCFIMLLLSISDSQNQFTNTK